MILAPKTTSFETRDLTKQILPSLDKNPAYWRMVEYIFWGTWHDKGTGGLVLSHELIREIEGKNDTAFYSSEQFLTSFAKDVFHIRWDISASSVGRARVLTSANIPYQLKDIIEKEKLLKTDKKCFFASGKPFTKAVQRRYRLNQQAEAIKGMASARVPEARLLLTYLNNLPPRTFHGLVLKNMDDAFNIARNLPKDSERQCKLLNTIFDFYQPFYGHVQSSDRVYALNPSIPLLQRDVRKALTKGWVEFDLQSAQLAIAATLWNINDVNEFLKNDGNIWEYLGQCVYVKKQYTSKAEFTANFERNLIRLKDSKPLLKKALYQILFGASKNTVKNLLLELGDDVPSRFFELDLIKQLWEKRSMQIKRIIACEGGETIFGTWLPVTGTNRKELYQSVCSILAQQCQAYELKLLYPAIELAVNSYNDINGFLITVWQHDGFTVYFKHKKNKIKHIEALIIAVNRQAEKLGIFTKFSYKID